MSISKQSSILMMLYVLPFHKQAETQPLSKHPKFLFLYYSNQQLSTESFTHETTH